MGLKQLVRAAAITAVALLLAASGTSASGARTSPFSFYSGSGPFSVSASFDSTGGMRAAANGAYDEGGLYYVTLDSATEVVHPNAAHTTRMLFDTSTAYRQIDGRPVVRIAWTDWTKQDAVWLTRDDTGSWISSRLWLGIASEPRIANMGSGLAVAFIDSHSRLRFLTWNPVTGASSAAIVANHCCMGVSDVVVKAGVVRIAFSEDQEGSGANRLRLATRAVDGTWSVSTVDARSTRTPSLALLSSGKPMIAYVVGTSGVSTARRTSSGWTIATVPGAKWLPALAADGSGRIALVAEGGNLSTGPKIVFRRLDLASTSTVTLATLAGDEYVGTTAIALRGGHAFVVYSVGVPGNSQYFEAWFTRQN